MPCNTNIRVLKSLYFYYDLIFIRGPSAQTDKTQTFTIELKFLWDQRLIVIIAPPLASHQLSTLL